MRTGLYKLAGHYEENLYAIYVGAVRMVSPITTGVFYLPTLPGLGLTVMYLIEIKGE